MKKSHLRSFIWAFLMIASLASYVYLKNVAVEDIQEFAMEETSSIEENSEEKNYTLLSEIAFAKKVIDLTKLIFAKE